MIYNSFGIDEIQHFVLMIYNPDGIDRYKKGAPMHAFLEILKAILYGIVEGITEWLPISSTGHLILLEEILPMRVSDDFWDMFLIVVQLGAILAVVCLFWNAIFPFSFKKGTPLVQKDKISLWLKIVIACLPGMLYAFVLDDILGDIFYGYIPVAIMLILVGVVFLIAEDRLKSKAPRVTEASAITYKAALIIGMFQLIAAIFPGTSRSGATIIGGLLIGLSRTVAAEFTFFLAIPVMAGASLLRILDFEFAAITGLEWAILGVGTLVSFAVSIVVTRFLMDYIKKRDFKAFGRYRIALGAIVLLYAFLK